MVIQDSGLNQFLRAEETYEHITAIKTILKGEYHDDFIIKNNLLY